MEDVSMFKKALLSVTVVLVLFSFSHAGSGVDLHEGKWEITVEFDMPGMPMKMPPNTYTQCITKESAVPKDEKPNQTCKTEDVKTKGNTITWTMVCTNPGGKMTGKGTITYLKDEMNGSMTMKGQGIKMISHYKGQRIGECN
jgi:hypothetical protein